MKNSYKILIGAFLLFGILQWATSSLEFNADGADKWGFPFNFYYKVSGINSITQQDDESTRFTVLSLAGDITFAFVCSWGLITLFNKIATTQSNR